MTVPSPKGSSAWNTDEVGGFDFSIRRGASPSFINWKIAVDARPTTIDPASRTSGAIRSLPPTSAEPSTGTVATTLPATTLRYPDELPVVVGA